MKYPAKFDPQTEGGYTITFRDVPEAISQANTIEEAKIMALDALITAFEFYEEENRALPKPSVAFDGEYLIYTPMES